MAPLWLPEREHVRLGAGVEQRDLQGSFVGRVVLAYELVQAAGPVKPLPSSSTSTTWTGGASPSTSTRQEIGWRVPGGQHQMRVARVEPVGDAAASPVEHDILPPDRPLADDSRGPRGG
jgi:hypothetical protein